MTAPLDQQAMRARHSLVWPADDGRVCACCGHHWPCDAIQALDALAKAERAGHAAFKVLARHGFVEHAGTWISRDEAERISKDGP